MLNHSSHVPNSRDLGKLRQVVETLRTAASMERITRRRRPGRQLRHEAEGILLLGAIMVAVCAYLLLMDRLGVPPAAMTDFSLID